MSNHQTPPFFKQRSHRSQQVTQQYPDNHSTRIFQHSHKPYIPVSEWPHYPKQKLSVTVLSSKQARNKLQACKQSELEQSSIFNVVKQLCYCEDTHNHVKDRTLQHYKSSRQDLSVLIHSRGQPASKTTTLINSLVGL